MRKGDAGPGMRSLVVPEPDGLTVGRRGHRRWAPDEIPSPRDAGPVTAGHRSGDDGAMEMRSVARPAPLAAALTLLTFALLAVMVAVRDTDPAGAVAVSLGLGITTVVGAVVATRRPEHPCGWLLVTLPVFAAASAASTDYVQSSLAAASPWPATGPVGWLSTWVGMPTVPLGALLLLTFPTGRLSSPRWRAVAGAAVVAALAQAVAVALMPGPLPVAPSMVNPLGITGAGAALEVVSSAAGTVVAVVLLASVGRLLLRYRHARGQERAQLRTLAAALPVTVLGLTAAMLAEGPLNEASFYFAVLGLVAIPVSIGWAVLRHGLFDIDVLINRALVYASLTVVVVVVYVVVVAGLGRALRQSVELGVSVVATAIVAVAFAPLRDRLQRAVDRLMYGDRPDPYAALSRLGRRLEDAAAPDQALPTTAEALGRSLKLDAVAIAALADGGLERAALWGAPAPGREPVRLDLVHGRELVGELAVWPRPGESLSSRDRALLVDLCRPVALAVHAVQVDRQLQESRQTLVTTREEERRRLRADLHDGLGPQLAGVVLGLGAARNTVRSDAAAAEELLGRLQGQLRETVTQVRSLVEGLAPAVDQLGLAGAIREGADRLTAPAGIALELDIGTLPELPAAVEVAAYRITMEALTNAVRHAAPTRCAVRVRYEDGGLHLRIGDDGQGLPATIVPGVGLSSMRQRAAELGGTCTVEPARGGGTRVLVRLPVR